MWVRGCLGSWNVRVCAACHSCNKCSGAGVRELHRCIESSRIQLLHPSPALLQCTEVTDLNTALNIPAPLDVNGPAWEAAVMVGFLLVLRFLVYVVLRYKTSGTRPS